jgi:GNAT superfamily N-acetyltransferase
MSVLRAPTVGTARLRVRTWHVDDHIAHVTPATDGSGPLTTEEVRRCIAELRRGGYRGAVTAAIGRVDQPPFLEAGFVPAERLHLLLHPLDDLPGPAPSSAVLRLHRGRRRDMDDLLAVDSAAFSGIWRLDRYGIDEALSATPTVHLRVARDPGGTIGYAICGRAGHRGYVQRLAVHPRAQGCGVGGTLLLDGLRWLRRWGARDALVNTQEGNGRSLRLYQRVGFVLEPDGLTVLRLDLGFDAP